MKHVFIFFIRIYQKCFSCLKGAPCCRFQPTCSEYAVQALQIHGALKGSWLAAKRLCRCHPFCKGGYDPVPSRYSKNKENSHQDGKDI